MSNKVYTIWLMIFGGIIGVILATWAVYSLRENIYTNTLQDTVRVSLYDAKDNSARVSKGTFIINTKTFENDIESSRIKEFNNSKLTANDISISYLTDSDYSGTAISGDYKAIKAVRVKVKIDTGSSTKDSQHNNSDIHVATYVIQKSTDNDSNDITTSGNNMTKFNE